MGVNITKKGNVERIVLMETSKYLVSNATQLSGLKMSEDTDDVMFILESLPPEEGLTIEKIVPGTDGNIVIANLYFDDYEDRVVFEDCNFRSIELLENVDKAELDEYISCVFFAKSFLEDAYNASNDLDRGVC